MVPERDRMVRHDGIKRSSGREAAIRPEVFIPAAPDNPASGGRLLGALAYKLDGGGFRRHIAQVHVQARLHVMEQMDMRVNEARQDSTPAQVQRIGQRTSE